MLALLLPLFVQGGGFMFGDGALDVEPVLNTITSKEYIPIIKRGLTSQGNMKQE